MALDGIVRMVDAFFRHWDDAKKMWSEYERGGFRLVVIGDELPLYPFWGAIKMQWCQGRAGLPRFRLQDLASLRSQCRNYQAQWPTGGWHWLGATRACRLEEHQLTGADGCRSHRQW